MRYTRGVTVLEPGTTFAGKYLIDGVLGKGGMGAVYSATNQAIGRRVAIKVLVPDLAEREDVKKRFELEARAAAVINHPGIVDVLDMGETAEGEPFIVMEYLEGATLKAVYKKRGMFTPGEAVGVLAPLLEALAAAHQANVIHRDIKPANIFLCTRPQRLVKLLDFGISRFGQSTGLTHSGTAVGTPKYMAPEQVLGEKNLGPGADVYSVGAVLYELLSGRAPYDADSDIATLARLLKEVHEPLQQVRPDLPAKLCAYVDLLLVKEPTQRPTDALAVKERLLALARPADLSPLFDVAQESAARTNTGGTPRPPSGPARLPATNPGGRRSSVTKMPAATQATVDDSPRPPRRTTRPIPKQEPVPSPKETAPELSAVPEQPKRRTGLVVGALLAVGALVVGATLFVLFGHQEPVATPVTKVVPPSPAPAVPKPTAPAAEARVVITLKAEPAATRFEIDGEKLEGNPVQVTRAKNAGVSVIAAAQGYEPRSLRLTFTEDKEELVTLTRLVAAVDVPGPPGKKPSAAPRPPTKEPGKKGRLTVDETNPYE